MSTTYYCDICANPFAPNDEPDVLIIQEWHSFKLDVVVPMICGDCLEKTKAFWKTLGPDSQIAFCEEKTFGVTPDDPNPIKQYTREEVERCIPDDPIALTEDEIALAQSLKGPTASGKFKITGVEKAYFASEAKQFKPNVVDKLSVKCSYQWRVEIIIDKSRYDELLNEMDAYLHFLISTRYKTDINDVRTKIMVEGRIERMDHADV